MTNPTVSAIVKFMVRQCKFRIGNQTAFSAECYSVPFDYAEDCGFDAFEWFPDKKDWGQGWDVEDVGQQERTGIRRRALSRGIRQSVHAPVSANPLCDGTMELIGRSVDFALDVGAVLVNVHLDVEQGVDAYFHAILPLIGLTAEAGIKLSIENTTVTGPEDFNLLFGLIGKLKDPDASHVGMCFDMGHANIYSGTRHDYLGYFDGLSPCVPVIHLHVHENYGDLDSHLALFTGPAADNPAGVTGLVSRLKRRGFDGSAILEQWPDPPSLLNVSRDGLAAICNSTSA
ncbi:MAG: sugar phosphate isomerase/epimerase [Nitrospirae bacterium]|nr:sugar phosphate isomerase/epimerase [Nitrospirota bacterium]